MKECLRNTLGIVSRVLIDCISPVESKNAIKLCGHRKRSFPMSTWTPEKIFSYVQMKKSMKVVFLYIKVKKDWNFPLMILLVSFPFQYGNEFFPLVTSVDKREPRGTFLSLGLFISRPRPTASASKMRPRLRKTFPRFPFVYFGNLGKTQIRGQKFFLRRVIEKKQNKILFICGCHP